MIGRKESDGRILVLCQNGRNGAGDRDCRSLIGRLAQDQPRIYVRELVVVENAMRVLHDEKRSLRWDEARQSRTRFSEQRPIAENGAKLLRPGVAGNKSRQSLQSSAITAGEDYRPCLLSDQHVYPIRSEKMGEVSQEFPGNGSGMGERIQAPPRVRRTLNEALRRRRFHDLLGNLPELLKIFLESGA